MRAAVRARLDQLDMHDTLLTVHFAAVYAGVSDDVIRQWKRRGWLTAADVQDGRPLFRPIDVLKAQAAVATSRKRHTLRHAAPAQSLDGR